ncbi:MAG: hypothetical protein AB7I32_02515 [Gammaproteobacteria bacterium]
MHLAYLDFGRDAKPRRDFLRRAGAAVLGGFGARALAAEPAPGFKRSGRMNIATAEDWIDTFFTGGADAIVHYYADDFVFEDVTLFQTISDKGDLHRAFLPFDDAGPDSPAGVHQFDVIRYDGGPAGDYRGVARSDVPANYSPALWQTWSADTLAGAALDYDEWAVIQWVWKATHNMDFLGLPARGRTTHCRGMSFHCYRERRIVREFTHWNFRDVAVQLGAMPPQEKFWLAPPARDAAASRLQSAKRT